MLNYAFYADSMKTESFNAYSVLHNLFLELFCDDNCLLSLGKGVKVLPTDILNAIYKPFGVNGNSSVTLPKDVEATE
jgi:hypothetical protein